MGENEQNVTTQETVQEPVQEQAQNAEQQPLPVSIPGVSPDTQEHVLSEIRKFSKKQVTWQRLSSLCILGALICIVVVLFILVPRVLETLDHINSVATKVETSLENVDVMVDEMTVASQNLNKLVGDNSQALTDAVEKMAGVDYDGLNQAIQDLQDAIGPMATFFNRFR